MIRGGMLVLLLVVVAGAAGCGSGHSAPDPTKDFEARKQQYMRQYEQEQHTPAARAEARRAEARQRKRDAEHAQSIMASIRAIGGDEAWLVRRVKVRGGEVTIYTDLYPKPSNLQHFIGACATAENAFDAEESVAVRGLDGVTHATWTAGNPGCDTQGVG